MAISFLAADAMWSLLDGGVPVVIANASEEGEAASVVAAVVALHGATGAPRIRRSTGTEIASGESVAFDEERPAPGQVLAVEAMLRVTSANARVTAEVYVASDAARSTPIDAVEVGITATDGAPSGAVPIPEIAGLSAYIKLEP